jgi:hypothetical protein
MFSAGAARQERTETHTSAAIDAVANVGKYPSSSQHSVDAQLANGISGYLEISTHGYRYIDVQMCRLLDGYTFA